MKMRHWWAILFGLVALNSHAADDDDEKAAVWDVSSPNVSGDVREVSIDVTEGTWMSLDVSPDGTRIAFDLLGDIYTIPVGGGEATPVSSGHAWDIQPRFSPDGSELAFISDRDGGDNVWVMNIESGEARQVSYEKFRLLNNPTWSPDGKYIAARKHFTTSRSLGTGEIWMYHSAGNKGSVGVQLVERPSPVFQKEQGEPAFSPDGKKIYYSLNVTPGNMFIYAQDSNTEIFQIRSMDLATGETATVAGGPGGAVRPAPSPDGRYLAHVKRVRARSRLFVTDLASGEERMLDDSLDFDMQETWAVHGIYPNMDWLPDSSGIVYWKSGGIFRVDLASGKQVRIPFHVKDTRATYGAARRSVEVAPDAFDTRMIRFASRSPDDKAIVFESLGRLFIKRGDSDPERLVRDEAGHEYEPVWSADGDRIYFLRWNDQTLSTLHWVGKRGGKARQLELARGQYSELAASPDGSLLALRKLDGSSFLHPAFGGEPGLYLYNLKAEEARRVIDHGQNPHFGPDARLYFNDRSSSPSGRGSDTATTQLLSVNFDGFDERELAQSEFAREIELAPTGDAVLFREHFQVYVSLLPATGQILTLETKPKQLPGARLSETGGMYPTWSLDGAKVSWSTGASFRTRVVADAISGASTTLPEDVNLSQRVQSARPDGVVALTGARVITMSGARDVIETATVLIEGNRIAAIGKSEEVEVPDGAKVIDVSGKTILPGFVDVHAHGPYGQGSIIPEQNWSSLAHLALGVTTLHNPSSNAHQAFAAAEYARAGRILSPRIFSTGEIIYGAKSRNYIPVETLDDALAAVRRLKAQGAISIKNYNQPRREQRQQVIEAARQEGMFAVAEGGALFHQDMNLIVDGITGIEHNIPTLNIYEDVVQLWSQTDVGYTPTLVVTFGGLTSEDYFYQTTEVWKHPLLSRFVPPTVLQPRSVRRTMAPESDFRDKDSAAVARLLMEAGVSVHTGAHGQREGLATHWEMWSFVRGGMSPMQALSTATINPANYLGMEADLGSVEVGKLADLVVLSDNPLDDIRHSDNVEMVMLNGRLYRAQSLDEVAPGDSRLEPFWWDALPQAKIR